MDAWCCFGDAKKNTDKKVFVLFLFGCRIVCQNVAVALLFSASYILLKKIVDFFIIPAMRNSYIDHGFAWSPKIIPKSTSCCTPWSVAAGGGNLCWLVGAPLLLGSAPDQDFSSLKLHSCPKTSWVASTSSSACSCPPWLVTSTI